MAEQLLSSTVLDNNFPSLGDLKGLVVAAVLLRLLGHQAHVAGVAHRGASSPTAAMPAPTRLAWRTAERTASS